MKRQTSASSSTSEKKVKKNKGSGSSGGKNDEKCWICFRPFPCESCERANEQCRLVHCHLCETAFHSHCAKKLLAKKRTKKILSTGYCPTCMLVMGYTAWLSK